MPNWCYNSTTFHGDNETLTKLVEAITTTNEDGKVHHDLTLLFPTPTELQIPSVFFRTDSDDPEHQELLKKYEANKAKYGHQDWYDWNIANWGTKWSPDLEESEVEIDGDVLSLSYDTAWSPPTGLLRKISEIFPTLLITNSFDEEGMGFWGCEAFQAGKEIASHGMSDGEMPEVFAERRKDIEERWNSDDDDVKWEAHEELMDINQEMKEFCEDTVYRLLRSGGFLPAMVE